MDMSISDAKDSQQRTLEALRGESAPILSPILSVYYDNHDLVNKEAPSLIFLSETKLLGYEMERVKRRLGLFGVSVDCCGRAGGLSLPWAKTSRLS